MDAQILDKLMGELLATQISVRALVLIIGDRAHLAVQEELERWLSSGLQTAVPDEFLAAFETVKRRVLPDASALERYPKKPV